MNLIRLGDRIKSRQRSPERGRAIKTADYIAQSVFDAQLEINDVVSLYLHSEPLVSAPEYLQGNAKDDMKIGEFEALCLDKILKPKRPVFAIVGPMGCGKSTTVNFIGLHLIKNVVKINCGTVHERLIGYIDFNLHQLNYYSGTGLDEKIHEIIADELWAKIRTNPIYDEKEEITDFWNTEITNFINHRSKSVAFRKILASLKTINLDGNLKEYNIRNRKNVLENIIKADPHLFVDYLIHLWKFTITNNYNSTGCAFILLDNIDRLHPVAQRTLLRIIIANSRVGGPTFVLLVRPETFDTAGLGTDIIDIEQHQGPSPVKVIKDRLARFCKNPDQFYDPDASLTEEQFTILKEYVLKTQKLIDTDRHETFDKFIEYSCGTSIRSGLLMAQGIFKVSVADMQDDISIRDVIRACITQGADQVRWSATSRIEHLFRISTSEKDAYLLKPRILRYMGRHEKGRRRLGEIINTLSGFGYSINAIRDALNDMMQINHQLIRSNGFDYYGNVHDLENNFGHYVKLTKAGYGYSNHLMMDIYYLQEVMLDTYVDGDRIPRYVTIDYLSEKFRLLHIFLNILREIDFYETSMFLSKWTLYSYIRTFGSHLLSLDIIQGVYPAVIGISSYQAKRLPHFSGEYEEIIDLFKSLALQVEADNNDLLGIWVDSVVEE